MTGPDDDMRELKKTLEKLGDLDEQLLNCVIAELENLRKNGVRLRELDCIHPSQVLRIMRGTYRPKMETLKKLAKAMIELEV